MPSHLTWSAIMRYATISAINLAILLVGIALGVLLAPHLERKVSAQQSTAPQPASQQPAAKPPSDAVKMTQVQPSMTTGTIGIYLILAHHIQSDELVVNGYDLLKLQDAELKILSRFVPPTEIQRVINDSKATELFQIPPPTPPAK